MYIRKIYILLFVLFSARLFAQTVEKSAQTAQASQPGSPLPDEGTVISNPAPASPDAASLGKYGNIPVSLYTGVPNISIPLYTIKSGDLNMPVSLSYHSGGNKVEEMASSVGLGWSLNAGGVITRTIRGKPDEELNGFLNQPSATQINSMIGHWTTLSSTQQGQLDYYLNATADGTLDSEPDIYNFNFCGYSGQFVMNSSGQITMLPLQNITFTFYVFGGQTTYIQSFTAKTPDGVTYYFGTDNAIEFSNSSGSNVRHAISWYLYKIVSPSMHEIDLTYTPESYNFSTSAQQTLYYFTAATGGTGDGSNTPSNVPVDNTTPSVTNVFTSVKLNKISFENGSLQIFANNFRYDINGFDKSNGAKTIDTVAITSGNFSKLYKFYYLNTTNKRLRLDSLVGQLDPIDGTGSYRKEKYSFSYLADSWSPNVSTLYAQDWWGYYNGKTNSVLVPASSLGDGTSAISLPGANRTPDESSILAGMLKSITYPTGGSTTFTFEANTESNKNLGATSNRYPKTHYMYGISNDPVSSYYNGTGNYIDKPALAFSISNVDNTPVAVNVAAYGLGSANPPASPPSPVDKIEAMICDSVNNFTHVIYSFPTPGAVISLPPGFYVIRVNDNTDQGNPNNGPNYIKYQVSVTYDGYTPAEIQAMKNNYIASGVRIREIDDYDGINTNPVNVKTYQYFQPGTTYSSGWLTYQPVYSYNLDIESQENGTIGPIGSWIDSYFTRTSTSNYPLTTTKGSVVGYSHVEEFLGANGENGKNEYFYTNAQSYPDSGGDGVFPFAPPEDYDAYRGLLLKQTTWKNTGSGNFAKVTEKVNDYSFIKFNISNFGIKVGFNPKPYSYSAYNSYFTNPGALELGRALETTYYVNTGYNYVSTDTTRVYDQNDQSKYLQTINNYQIDSSTYQITQIQSTNSKNEKIIQTVTYPYQYNPFGSTGVANLITAGITTYPIEEVTQKSNPDGSNLRTVKAVYSTYKLNGPYRDSVYEMRSVTGIPNFRMSTTGPIDSHYQPVVSFDKYDSYGNIIQEKKIGDAVHTYIWGYNNLNAPYNYTYPIAEVINADSVSVAYTNFEQLRNSGASWGNWTFNYAGITTDATAPMGASCYSISGTNTLTRSGLSSSNKYVVSFWSKSGAAITVTGGTVTNVATGNAKNGWIYHEYSVTGASSVTIGGTGSIDEVRLYPSTAQMSTYTYIPLVGMASKCDTKNDITYYVYDNVGRLIQVLDQNQNVVKQYQYNYTNTR
ncbi:MAG TPA: hypothetical protein VIM89_10540 [Mucilaginibacter sp.]